MKRQTMKPCALIHIFTLLAFLISSFGTVSIAQARVTAVGGAGLEFAKAFSVSKPGTMVQLSPAFNSPVLKGIKVHPKNPFRFDFILDPGGDKLSAQSSKLKAEAQKLIKYFLASLTIPEKDLWVRGKLMWLNRTKRKPCRAGFWFGILFRDMEGITESKSI